MLSPEEFEPPEDLLFYNISTQEWQEMTLTRPDGAVQYFTETSRPLFRGKRTTFISKVDAASSGAPSALSTARRTIARLEFRPDSSDDTVTYGMKDYKMDEFFPTFPQGEFGKVVSLCSILVEFSFRRVAAKDSEGWIWTGTRGEPTVSVLHWYSA